MPISAFKLITPTSIVVAGGTASVGQFGKVSFSAATSLSLNGVFSSTYDNYMVVVRNNGSGLLTIRGRLRASGTDNTTASSYVTQYLFANGASVTALRYSPDTFMALFVASATQRDGHVGYFFGPYLAQPTAVRSVTSYGEDGARMFDTASTHNQSTAYDGFTMYVASGSFSGEIAVYGCNQ
jgi:hypothetical protein